MFYHPPLGVFTLQFVNGSAAPLDFGPSIQIDNVCFGEKIQIFDDLMPPDISCPTDITIQDTDADCAVLYTIPNLSITDPSGVALVEYYLDGVSVAAGSTHSLDNSIIHEVMCIAADVCGNRDTCVYIITVQCIPVQCTCPTNIPPFTITQGQDRIDVSCGQRAVLDCPVTDLFINGMIKCQSSHPVIPCPPNSVTWTLDRPGLFDLNGTSSSSVSLLFNASTVSDPGIYILTFSTICPDSPEPCICVISWFQPDCDPNAFCQGNIVQNGDFESNDPVPTTADDIANATSWSSIWSAANSTQNGNFLNSSITLHTSLTQPLPVSQGNYAGFWLDYSSDNNKREGIMNTLVNPILQNSGCYTLEFMMACLGQQYNDPVLEVFGVPTTAVGTISSPFNQTTPMNSDLFTPAAISLGNFTVNTATCTNNFMTVNIDFNSSILPALGIDRIFFTRRDVPVGGSSGGAYIALDDICLTSTPCDQECTCPIGNTQFTLKEGNNSYTTSCSSPISLVPTLDCPVNDLTITGNYGCVSSNPNMSCPSSEIKWTLDRPLLPDLTGSQSGPNFGISFIASSIDDAGTYSLTLETICNGEKCTCVIKWVQKECSDCACPVNPTFTLKEGNNSPVPVFCNQSPNTIPVLDCPIEPVTISGNFGCVSSNPNVSCPPSEIKWTLDRPLLPDLAGSQSGPNFGISFIASSIDDAGTYSLTLETICNGEKCTCVIKWVQRACSESCCTLFSTSPAINPFGLTGGKSILGMDFIDVNGDTYMDHIYSNSSQLLYRLNPGNGTNFGSELVLTSNLREPYNCDYDDDGKEDIFGIRITPALPSFGFIKNLGGGSFNTFNSILTLSNVRFAVGDVGQDGVVDLLTVNSTTNSQIMYYEGIPGTNPSFKAGVPWFTTNISNTFNAEFPIPELYDIDCDGDLDLFLGLSGEIRSFTNNGGVIAPNVLPNFNTVTFTTQTYNQVGNSEFITPRYVTVDNDFFTEFFIDYNNAQQLLYFDCATSAVDETLLSVQQFKVFPNPTSNMVTLKYTGNQPVTANLDILNLWGQNVQTINKVNLDEDYTLDISNLRAGMYLLRIATKHNNHVFLKIIKTE